MSWRPCELVNYCSNPCKYTSTGGKGGSPRRKNSVSALRSTSAYKSGLNLLLSAIDKGNIEFANVDVPPFSANPKVSAATDVPPVADEPMGDGFLPQGSTAATPCSRSDKTTTPRVKVRSLE